MIDTVIYTRSAVHGVAIMDSLQAGDIGTAKFVGIPLDIFFSASRRSAR
jgi:DHA2 family multidrug resistance protein